MNERIIEEMTRAEMESTSGGINKASGLCIVDDISYLIEIHKRDTHTVMHTHRIPTIDRHVIKLPLCMP